MLFKLSAVALVALLGFHAHAQLTAADVVKDMEKIDEVYDEAIDYLASHGPDSVDFDSRMDGFNDRLIDGYTEAIADVKKARFSFKDQATISKEFAHLDSSQARYQDKMNAIAEINFEPPAGLLERLKETFTLEVMNDLPGLDEEFSIGN